MVARNPVATAAVVAMVADMPAVDMALLAGRHFLFINHKINFLNY